jgi:hypothetical protein
MVIAYLTRKKRKSFKEVFEEVRRKRPEVNLSPECMVQLEIWEKTGYHIWRDKARAIPKPLYRAYLGRRKTYLKANGLSDEDDFQIQEI